MARLPGRAPQYGQAAHAGRASQMIMILIRIMVGWPVWQRTNVVLRIMGRYVKQEYRAAWPMWKDWAR